ncbi:DUF72 domain-containing protein [Halolamina salifodinae]|uniref:Uncharacterized protein YecE (DUF72 family) n=1 Tax=Halolamina salifodinae TaxID=1202767 RepID=A0A8T4H3Y4_9EURY|nr:DUF72 domain-containing protein [Halolamina salifodinae]MBP1988335.1 uncharacterized protein YecE (DUF72 family) [Halolamina salifodinae]
MADGEVRIGTCGYRWYDPESGWKERYESKLAAYADDPAFDLVELNTTFYSLPQQSTAERWREEAGEGFEFSAKGWQALTHEWRSPTWNGEREDVEDDDALDSDEVGGLRPTESVREAWRRTAERAAALDAGVALLQTPPSFGATDEHGTAMREFLGDIDREGLTLAWEPRGSWLAETERVAEICTDLDLVHVVDPLRDYPVSSHSTAYLRLHGLNADRYDYAYDYDAGELDTLAERVDDLRADHETVYVLFNNDARFENARALGRRFD